MKKTLFVFAAAALVFFSACRHDDFELLRHQVHIQGGANVHLGTPVGNGEMSIDDLFNMINDPTIDSLMDTTSANLITLRFETSIDTTVSGSSMNINFKKAIGQMKVSELPWGQTKVNRRWQPVRRSGDRSWSPKRSNRVIAAKSGAYTTGNSFAKVSYGQKPSTVDNIFTYADTISYAMNLDMLSGSSFFNDADFEFNTVDFNLNMTLNAQCQEDVRHYLDDYITFTIDSVMIFYTTEDGQLHLYDHAPFDGSMAPMVYGHDSPTGIGITQQPMVIPFTNVNIAEIVNAKPTSIRARFRFKLDVARSLVLDVVSRPEFDTTGLFLTGIDLNTISLNDVSNLDSATLMNDIQNNLANIDTLATINYLFNTNIDTTNPQTVLDFLNIDTAFVLNYLGIDTTQPRSVLYAAGITDTSDLGLAAGAGLPLNATGDAFDTCELITRATHNAVNGCTDTNGLIAAITHDSGIFVKPNGDTVYDTNYFIQLLTGDPNMSISNPGDLIGWVGIDTSESNINNLLLDAGVDTSDHDALLFSVFNRHLNTHDDTNWYLQQALNNPSASLDDEAGLLNIFGIDTASIIASVDTATLINNIDTAALINSIDTAAIVASIDTAAIIAGIDTAAIIASVDTAAIIASIDTAAMINGIDTAGYINWSDYVGLTPAQIQHKKDSIMNHVRDSIMDHVRDSVMNHVRDSVMDHVRDSVMDYVRDSVMTHVRDSIMDYVRDSITNYVRDSIVDMVTNQVRDSIENRVNDLIQDRVATYVEDVLTDYLEDRITDTVMARINRNIVPRITDYVVDEVTTYVTEELLKAYKDTIIEYLKEQVMGYVTGVLEDTLHTYMQERIENFTSLKDTLVGIMNDVSQSDYNCNVNLSVSIPFEMKINSLAYPLDVELWKDGGNPVDVEAILNKLPNFIDASLDDSYFNMKVTNSMPLEFLVRAELLDANKQVLCTLIDNDTIKSAPLVLDENSSTVYVAKDSTISVISAAMNQEKLFKVKNSKYVRMNLTLSSGSLNDVRQFVAVRRSDKMAFRAYLQANANANVDITVPHTPLPIPNIF